MGRQVDGRPRRFSRRARIALAVTGVTLASAALGGTVLAAEGFFTANGNPWPYNNPGRSPVLAAVGDIACQPGAPVENEKPSDVCKASRWQAQTATANQIENNIRPSLVALLGDEQYQAGRYEDFMGSFDHTYGAFKFLQRPSAGNHEFYTSHGETGVHGYGYFDYYNGYQVDPSTGAASPTAAFGPAAPMEPTPRQDGQAGHFGPDEQGWYSYNLGAWHIISLNAECNLPEHGNCDTNSAWYQSQTNWLARDLASNHAACTMAYWHQPTFSATNPPSSGPGGDPEGPASRVWWQLLYRHHADLVMNGHDHLYARFAPQDPNGNADPSRGIREFIVGTGGESLDTYDPSTPNVQTGTGSEYGVMKLTLNPNGYAWNYQPAPGAPGGSTYTDAGSARCHSGSDRDGGER